MTTYMPLDCDGFATELADYLEGEAPDAVRAAMEAHAAGCTGCRQLLEDIDTIRDEAAALPALTPSRDLWAGIAERIDAPVLSFERKRSTIVVRRTWARPAIAAAALVVFTAGITYSITTTMNRGVAPTAATSGQVAAAPQPLAPSAVETPSASGPTTVAITEPGVTSSTSASPRNGGARNATTPRAPEIAPSQPVRFAGRGGENVISETEPVYDREIAKLRRIVKTRGTQLDPKTITVLEQSIAVIDSAIAQSRAALKKDPASGFLAKELNHSLEKKVELLRTAAMLPART
jgi:anti-sigma factor RsiW